MSLIPASSITTPAYTSNSTWVPCTCACHGSSTTKFILVRILPTSQGFCAQLADPTSGQVWVDLVDSAQLLQERKQQFAPSLLIPLDELPSTLADTLCNTLPTHNTTVGPHKPQEHPQQNFISKLNNASKMRLDFEWIPRQTAQPLGSGEQPIVHLKCTQRTSSSLRFTWTFVGMPLDPPQAAQVLASDLVDPLFRVLHWQILETNHLALQLEQAKRDLALVHSLLPDPNAVRVRPFSDAYIPINRDVDYAALFGNRTRWSQALGTSHLFPPPSKPFNLPRPAPPVHAHSQPVVTPSHSSVLPAPRAIHSSPALAASMPSSDIAQPAPMLWLPPQAHRDLPSAPFSSQMLAFLLSSSQTAAQSQQGSTLPSDPPPPSSDPPTLSVSSSLARPASLASLSRIVPNPSNLRPRTKSPIALELADSQPQSQSQSQSQSQLQLHFLGMDHSTADPPPPPMSPRSLLASLPPTLVIPSTVPVPVPDPAQSQWPPSSQRTTSSSSLSASSASQFAMLKSPANTLRGFNRKRENEEANQGDGPVAAGGMTEPATDTAASKPKKKKHKHRLF